MITNHQPHYQPSNLLDTLIVTLGLKNDAALSRTLKVGPAVLSKIRNRHMPISAGLLLRMHEETDISIQDLRELMGDHRSNSETCIAMEFKLSAQEQDALRKLASLGSVYYLLHGDYVTLMSCGLIERRSNGVSVLTSDGRKYLRELDLEIGRKLAPIAGL